MVRIEIPHGRLKFQEPLSMKKLKREMPSRKAVYPPNRA